MDDVSWVDGKIGGKTKERCQVVQQLTYFWEIFIPTLGEMMEIWLIYVLNGLVQPPTRIFRREQS